MRSRIKIRKNLNQEIKTVEKILILKAMIKL